MSHSTRASATAQQHHAPSVLCGCSQSPLAAGAVRHFHAGAHTEPCQLDTSRPRKSPSATTARHSSSSSKGRGEGGGDQVPVTRGAVVQEGTGAGAGLLGVIPSAMTVDGHRPGALSNG